MLCSNRHRFKPKQLQRNKPLLKAIIEALCEMACEPLPEDYDEAQDIAPRKVGVVLGGCVLMCGC